MFEKESGLREKMDYLNRMLYCLEMGIRPEDIGIDIKTARSYLDDIFKLAVYDGLTKVYSRTFFDETLRREMGLLGIKDGEKRRHIEYSKTLVMLDVVGLKTINDIYGHYVGDELLRGLGELIRNSIRRGDIPARYGGDEFVVLFINTDENYGMKWVTRLCQGFTEMKKRLADEYSLKEDDRNKLSLRFGISTTYIQKEANELLRDADPKG